MTRIGPAFLTGTSGLSVILTKTSYVLAASVITPPEGPTRARAKYVTGVVVASVSQLPVFQSPLAGVEPSAMNASCTVSAVGSTTAPALVAPIGTRICSVESALTTNIYPVLTAGVDR